MSAALKAEPPSLPVLDLSHLITRRAEFLRELRAAARDVGFFQLTGHGIPRAQGDGILAEARRFFALPQAAKDAVAMVNSPHFRGYTAAGGELTRGRPDWREQFDVHVERGTIIGGPAWTQLIGPNQWPEALPSLRPAVTAWQAAMTAVATRLLRAFALALEAGEDAFDAILDPPQHTMKLIRYPGLDPDPEAQGVSAHKDSGLLTFVLQDTAGGLQAEAEGGWLDASPIPDAFVVNIGELLELATNGYLRATVHRVLPPPPATERVSVAFFLSARLDAEVPLLRLPPHLAAEARGPASDPQNPLFRQIGQNALKGRLRSHPDVATRWHADLLSGS